jgi:hypothetical protein
MIGEIKALLDEGVGSVVRKSSSDFASSRVRRCSASNNRTFSIAIAA